MLYLLKYLAHYEISTSDISTSDMSDVNSSGDQSDSMMTSPGRQDSMSEYSNMSEPGKLEIDTGGSGSAPMDSKAGGDNEVSNVCILCFVASFALFILPFLFSTSTLH